MKKLLANATAAKVDKAEQLSTKVQDFFAANQVPPHVALRAQGFLRVDLISLILEKKKFKKHDSMEAAVEAAVSVVNSRCGLSLTSPVSLPSATPWQAPAPNPRQRLMLQRALNRCVATKGHLKLLLGVYR